MAQKEICSIGFALIISFASVQSAQAQALAEASTGPIIEAFGPVYSIDAPDFATPTGHVYRVVFDVALAPESPGARNPRIETLARFLNMHAQAGVAKENMKLALVLHGSAGRAALENNAYRSRFGIDNPDLALLHDLGAAGVSIILCGQTAIHRGLPRESLTEQIQVALSAMTALVALQDQGYRLIAF